MAHAIPRTILVPTDFSDTADNALRHARELAAALGASLHLLHVVSSDLGGGAPELWGVDSEGLSERLESRATAELDQRRVTLESDGFSAHVATRTGPEVDAISDYVREHDVDLVMIGTHGRGGVQHLLLGSVAEKVVRRAPCPVLVVPPPR